MRESEILQHIFGLGSVAGRAHEPLGGSRWWVEVGPGDDCGVLKHGGTGERLLLTVDQLVEGRHFEAGLDLDLIARKAVARSVSDIAAMGGRPAWSLATGLLPAEYPHGKELSGALHRWASHWGCPMVGGDIAFLCEGGPGPLSLTVTVGGALEPGVEPVLRSGARAGHGVFVTGKIGGSLESGRHARFEPRVSVGQAVGQAVVADDARTGAMIDLSDGLGIDAARIGVASGVVLEIEASALPLNPDAGEWRAACAQGEDYELLFTTEPAPEIPGGGTPITRIGRARACREGEEPGAVIVDERGVAHDGSRMGWDHGG